MTESYNKLELGIKFGDQNLPKETLYEQFQFMQSALNKSVLLSITDNKGIIEYVNEKLCQVTKYTPEELIGQPYCILNSGHHPSSFFQEMWSVISTGNVWEGEICNKAKDGTLFWLMTTIVPFLDKEGKPIQYLAIRMDITKRKQAESEIQLLTSTLEEQVCQRTAHLEALNEEFSKTIQNYAMFFSNLRKLLEQMEGVVQGSTADIQRHLSATKEQMIAYKELSDREQDVLLCLVQGKTNQEISESLHLSIHTVKTYVSSIMQKLNVSDRTNAAIIGIKLGLINQAL